MATCDLLALNLGSNEARAMRSAWADAFERHALATAALERFRVEVGRPTSDSLPRMTNLPEKIAEEWERLGDEQSSAADALMATPAPDGFALLWKLQRLLELESDGNTPMWSGDYVAQTRLDMGRILEGF